MNDKPVCFWNWVVNLYWFNLKVVNGDFFACTEKLQIQVGNIELKIWAADITKSLQDSFVVSPQ